MVKHADRIGNFLKARRLSTSQIRAFFGEVRRIDLQDLPADILTRKIHLMRPKLAYGASRHDAVKILQRILDPVLVDLGKSGGEIRNRFKNFTDFFEAILAYFKFYGGK